MTIGIPTEALRIAELFADPHLFAVPTYQRPYSWTIKEAGQLLEDIVGASGVDYPETAEPDYFLGAMLLLQVQGGAREGRRQPALEILEIVDGQQRLVTLAILLSALRDIDESDEVLSEVAPLLATAAPLPEARRTAFRVELRGAPQTFMESCVLAEGACSEMPDERTIGATEQRMLDIRESFIAELGKLDAEQRLALVRYIKHCCYVVVIITGDIDRAHRMFLVLNGRGKPLTRHDILKAEILNKVPAQSAERVLASWDGVAQRLDEETFETFFSHMRIIHGHSRAPVIAGIRAIIQEAGGAEAFMDTVFTPLAGAYRAVLEPGAVGSEGGAASRIARSLRYLNRLSGQDWMPAAMIAVRRYAGDPERLAAEMAEIERFAHVLRLLCLGSGRRLRRFAEVIEALRAGRSLAAADGPCRLARDERRAIAYHLRDLHTRNPQICKLALLRLNDEMSGRFHDIDPAAYTVEHILPQRLPSTSPWRTHFADPQLRETCVKSLGNLLLVIQSLNDRARNQDFLRKRDIYAGAQGGQLEALSAAVLTAEAWRPQEVRAREDALLEILDRIWRLELPREPVAGAATQRRRRKPTTG